MRRTFLKSVVSLAALSLVATAFAGLAATSQPAKQAPAPGAKASPRNSAAADALGLSLGTQAWTFRDRTAFEAVDIAADLGLTNIELFTDQTLSPEHKDVKVGPGMAKEHMDALKKKLADRKVVASSFGVVGFKKDEVDARAKFEFAKAMGMGAISCEPEFDAWDLVEKLAVEYNIRLAVHNHPKPSRYWSPEIVLEHVGKRSKLIGACADTGHWPRSGLSPVDQLKKLEGRIVELHFKDVAPESGKPSEYLDRPWGTGHADAKAMLRELVRQKFKGVVLVEYENTEGKELEENVRKCVAFFDSAAAEILKEQGK
ncbi:MAG: sugar phosphate isomerase/epimerase [Phycisphaerales bacterium]